MNTIALLRQCQNIYDILAVAYSKLVPYEYKKVANCDFTKFKRISNAVGMYIEQNENNCVVDISNLIFTICQCIESGEYEINESFYYNLIHQIDSSITYKYSKIGKFFRRYEKVGILNSNGDKLNIYVLPKMQHTIIDELEANSEKYEKSKTKTTGRKGLRKRNRKENISSINSQLHHFVLYESNLYKPNLTILLDNHVFRNQINSKQVLKIGVIPFSKQTIEDLFQIEYKRDTFSIVGVKAEHSRKIYDLFKQELEIISKEVLDIIIFPEMYLTDEIIKDLKTLIQSTYSHANNQEKTQIIATGTCWKTNSNRCYVYDNFGNEIFVQNKFTPFDYNGKIEELCPTDHEINMLDIEGVGRIIVLICKDITNSKLKDFIGEVKGDILCYPAYSPSLEVITQSRSVSEDFNVISIFSNACAPRISRDTIGYCKFRLI